MDGAAFVQHQICFGAGVCFFELTQVRCQLFGGVRVANGQDHVVPTSGEDTDVGVRQLRKSACSLSHPPEPDFVKGEIDVMRVGSSNDDG